WLFDSTLRENLRFGNPEASDAEINDALKASYMYEFVERLPEKWFYNILCWWKIEGDFLLTLFLRFNSKRDSLLVKFSRPKRHPT
ncbi:hypothetical protein, partial [Enterococcus faecium]|uniref:hypothetical protein n=1 Tax=Enterococcus faecium TaxID=1352 RepID=UPI00292E533D